MSLVSVIIPNYNNGKYLTACIESCLEQEETYLKEIIIVDDHSDDNSWDILLKLQDKFPSIIKIFKNPVKGGNNARNYGFIQSTGDYIQWLDSDDIILSGKFKAQVSILQQDLTLDIAYSDWMMNIYDKNGKLEELISKKNQHFEDYLQELLINTNWTAPNNYLLKRKIAEKLYNINAWNPETIVEQDREYFTLAGIAGARFVYVPGTFSIYNRWSHHSVSKINFSKRLECSFALAQKFIEVISKKDIPPNKKNLYLSILNTELLKSCFYNSSLRLKNKVPLESLKWSLFHWKMKFVIPYVYARQNILLIIAHLKS